MSTVHPLAAKNANRLTVGAAADPGMMHADATRLRQCLLNLLSNACKFTKNGTVVLTVERVQQPGGDSVRITASATRASASRRSS